MANKEVKITFLGEDKLGQAYKTADAKIKAFSNSVVGAAEPMASFGKAALAAEAALISLVGAGIVYATAKFNEFQSSEVALTKVLDDQSTGAYPQVKNQLRDLSNEYGIASASVNQITTDFVKSGQGVEEAASSAKLATDLFIGAAEAEFTVEKATNALIKAKKGFNLTQEQTVELANQWNYTANTNATSVEFLADAFARTSKVAADAGFDMAELNGTLTPMIEVFQNAEQPATAFNSVLLGLSNPTGQLADGLELLGIELQKSNGEWKTSKELFLEVGNRMGEVDEHTRTTSAAMIAGKEHAAKIGIAFSKMSKTAEIAAAATSGAAQTSLGKEVAAVLATSEKQIARWQTTFNNAFIDVGAKISTGTGPIVAGATEINIAFQKLVDEGTLDEVFKAYQEFGTDVGQFLEGIAKSLPEAFKNVDFTGLLKSFSDVKNEIIDLFDVDLTTPEGLADAIQFIVDSLESLQNITAGVIDGVSPFVKILKETAETVNNLDSDTKELVGSISGFAIGIVPVITGLKAFRIAMTAIVSSPLLVFITGVTTQYKLLKDALKESESALDKFLVIIRAASSPFNLLLDKVGQTVTGIKKTDTPLEKLKKGLQALYDPAGALSGAFDKLTDSVNKPAEKKITVSDQEAVNALKEFERKSGEVSEIEVSFNYQESERKSIQALKDFEKENNINIDVGVKTKEADVKQVTDALSDISTFKVDFQNGLDFEIRTGKTKNEILQAKILIEELQEAATKEEQINILSDAAERGIDIVKGKYEQFGTDAEGNPIMLLVNNQEANQKLKETKDAAEELPKEKLLEIKLQGEIDKEIAKIKATADTIQNAVEWKAKVDIEKAKADMERFKASVEATSKTITGLAAETTGLYSGYDDSSTKLQSRLDAQARLNQKHQQENQDAQQKLLALEAERLKLQNRQLRDGKGGMHLTLDESIEPVLLELLKSLAETITTQFTGEGFNLLYS